MEKGWIEFVILFLEWGGNSDPNVYSNIILHELKLCFSTTI